MEEEMPKTIWDVPTPAFLVDLDIVKKNCNNMIEKCKKMGVTLRPHMKTHKTLEGALLMTGGTKRCIVVSTLTEAEFYAENGFEDILLGVIFIENKLKRCQALANKLEEFHLMIDNPQNLDCLERNPLQRGKNWSVFLKIDCGNKRCGMPWDSSETIELAEMISRSPAVQLKGLYTHCGGTYACTSAEEIKEKSNEFAERMAAVSNALKAKGIEFSTFGIGSTPTASQTGDKVASLINEIHPGNYIFRDMQQVIIGGSTIDEIACRLATRVIGHYPHDQRMCIDCGFTALTCQGKNSMPGNFVHIQGEPNLKLTKMSQEVGCINPIEGVIDFEKYPINSLLFFHPYHSCATACCHRIYYVHSGEKIVDIWRPVAGW